MLQDFLLLSLWHVFHHAESLTKGGEVLDELWCGHELAQFLALLWHCAIEDQILLISQG